MNAAAPRRRTQVERRNESEEALLDAAAELVAERGVERASLARIGERAGASRGLPTHHFGSKDALVARLAQRAQNQIDDASWAAVKADGRPVEELSALDLLRTTVDTYLRRFENPSSDDRALIVMWGATFPAEASVEGMLDADRRSRDGWAGLIEKGQGDGSIRADVDAWTGAVLLQGLVRGVAANLLTDAHLTEKSRVRQTCQVWITSALAPHRDGVDQVDELAQAGTVADAGSTRQRRSTYALAAQGLVPERDEAVSIGTDLQE